MQNGACPVELDSCRVLVYALDPTSGYSFPGGSEGKESACCVGDVGLIPGWGRSPGEENGNPLQYSCLENSMDRGTWQATVHGIAKSRPVVTREHLPKLGKIQEVLLSRRA